MTRYRITYDYVGKIEEEIKADTLQEALEKAEEPGSKYTVDALGIEIDLWRAGRPRVTVVKGR